MSLTRFKNLIWTQSSCRRIQLPVGPRPFSRWLSVKHSAVSGYFLRRSTCVRDPLERDRSVKIGSDRDPRCIETMLIREHINEKSVGGATRSCHIVKMIMDIITLRTAFGRIQAFYRHDVDSATYSSCHMIGDDRRYNNPQWYLLSVDDTRFIECDL